MASCKRRELSLAKKVELIGISVGKSQRELAQMFDIGKTQVQTILKRKSELTLTTKVQTLTGSEFVTETSKKKLTS